MNDFLNLFSPQPQEPEKEDPFIQPLPQGTAPSIIDQRRAEELLAPTKGLANVTSDDAQALKLGTMPVPAAQPVSPLPTIPAVSPIPVSKSEDKEPSRGEPADDGDQENTEKAAKKPDVYQYLRDKYNLDTQDQLKEAQEQQRENLGKIGVQRGVDQIVQGLTRGATTPDEEYYKQQIAQSGLPVQNVKDLIKGKQEELAQQRELESFVKEKTENDPNSELNQNFRDFIRNALPQVANKMRDLDSLTIGSAGPLQKMADAYMTAEGHKIQREAMQQYQQEKLDLQRDKLKSETDQKNASKIAQAYDKTQSDKTVLQLKGQLAQADELQRVTADATTNPQSANALAAVAARYVSGGQRINRQEMEALGSGSKAITDKLEQIMTTGAKGTLSPENAAFMQKFIKVTRDSARQSYNDALKQRADSYSKIYGVDKSDLYDKFGVSENANNESTVRMQAPDGTVRLVPASKVQDAIKAGGKTL